jgi:BirA family transcriptional regulator, biotin operon repressor / biotin---[acetyl-CoA-carboxylase] ligase
MFISLFSEKQIIHLQRINSTNDFAAALIKNNETAEGTVIWADVQTAGKGQKGNVWDTEADNNLTFSFILHPLQLNPAEQFMLNKAISLGIIDYLKTIIDPLVLKIKWPNDIYAGKMKLAGILIENEILGDSLQTAIVGIGLNVNQKIFNINIPNPTSLAIITGKKFDIPQQLSMLLSYIEKRIINLYNNDIELINNDYLKNLLYYGITNKFNYKDREIEAIIMGISEYGELKLKLSNDEIIVCGFKEIEFLHH